MKSYSETKKILAFISIYFLVCILMLPISTRAQTPASSCDDPYSNRIKLINGSYVRVDDNGQPCPQLEKNGVEIPTWEESSCSDPNETRTDLISGKEIDSETGIPCDQLKKTAEQITQPTKSENQPNEEPAADLDSITIAAPTTPIYTARGIIDVLRRHVKFNLPATNSDASYYQRAFETDLSTINKVLDTLENTKKVVLLIDDLTAVAPIYENAEKISNLSDKIINFETSGKTGLLDSFKSLQGHIPGFDDEEANIAIESYLVIINDLVPYWKDNNEIKKTVSLINGFARDLVLQLMKARNNSGVSYDQTGVNTAWTSAEDTKKALIILKKELSGLYYKQVYKLSTLEYLDEYTLARFLMDLSNQQYGETAICTGQGVINRSSGSSDGFPAEEGRGPLLDYTGQLIDYSASLRSISQQTCELTYLIKKKEYELDTEATKLAQESLEKSKQEFFAQLAEGRQPSDNLEIDPGKSFYPTLDEFIAEEVHAAELYFFELLDELAGISVEEKNALKEASQMRAEAERTPESAFKAKLAPNALSDKLLEKKDKLSDAEYYDALTKVSDPQNSYYGQAIKQSAELQRMKAQAAEMALQEYSSGQGVIAKKVCVNWFRTNDSTQTPVCTKWENVTPQKMLGDMASAYATLNLDLAKNVKEISDIPNIGLNNRDGEMIDVGPNNFETTPLDTQETLDKIISNISSGNGVNIESSVKKMSGGNSGGGDGGNPSDPKPPADFPAPKVTQKTSTDSHGIKSTTLSWDGNNSEGKVTNDWVSYTGLTPKTVKKNGDALDKGEMVITHPTAFSFAASASGSSLLGPTPNTQNNFSTKIANTDGKITQTTTFVPNIYLFRPGDSISIQIGNQYHVTSFSQSPITKKIISDFFARSLRSSGLTTEVTAGGDLIISKTVTDKEFPASADYKMNFTNSSGTRFGDTTIKFL